MEWLYAIIGYAFYGLVFLGILMAVIFIITAMVVGYDKGRHFFEANPMKRLRGD
jgi:hypothetical protein